jgi:hypothetical protein
LHKNSKDSKVSREIKSSDIEKEDLADNKSEKSSSDYSDDSVDEKLNKQMSNQGYPQK